jgi:hypothetical protein
VASSFEDDADSVGVLAIEAAVEEKNDDVGEFVDVSCALRSLQ